jgi:hypothetical protein
VQQFSQTLIQHLNQNGGDLLGAGLGAVQAAGGDVQQFADNLSAQLPPPPSPQQSQQGQQTSGGTVSGVPQWLTDLISQNAPGQLANDPTFIQTVAAGAKAESGWDPNRIQQGFSLGSGSGARGLFQFDMGGMGAGYNEQDLLGQAGAALQAAQIVPQYAQAYLNAPANLSPAEKASWVAGQAERPLDYTDPTSAARRNYASAFNDIVSGATGAGQSALSGAQTVGQTAVNTVSDAAQSAVARTSQFAMGLSSGDAMSFCGPAAAMAFAQTFGRNPTVDEARQLAQQVGWNPDSGMAGPTSEVALLNKLGIDTHMTSGVDWNQVAGEASSGNPVIIDTPGHYFYVDGYNAQTGQYHLGTSATDLKAANGQQWFTPSQIPTLGMGDPRAAIYADHPLSSTSSVATNSPQSASIMSWLDQAGDTLGSIGQQAQDTLSAVLNTGTSSVQDATSAASDWLDQQKDNLSSKLQSVASTGAGQQALRDVVGPLLGMPPSGSVSDTTGQDLAQNVIGPLLGMPPGGTAQAATGVGPDVLQNVIGPLLGMPPGGSVQALQDAAANPTQTLLDTLASGASYGGPYADLLTQLLGGAPGRGAQAAADVLEQQRQGFVDRPDVLTTLANAASALQQGDIGGYLGNAMDLASRAVEPFTGGSMADVSPSVSAGLTAAGVNPTTAQVLGQLANFLGPAALESRLPAGLEEVARQLGPAELDNLVRSISPEEAYRLVGPAYGPSSTVIGAGSPEDRILNEAGQVLGTDRAPMSSILQAASGTDVLQRAHDALGQYPDEIAGPLRSFVQDQIATGQSPTDVASTVLRFLQENPLGHEADTAAALGEPVESALEKLGTPEAARPETTPTAAAPTPTEAPAREPAPTTTTAVAPPTAPGPAPFASAVEEAAPRAAGEEVPQYEKISQKYVRQAAERRAARAAAGGGGPTSPGGTPAGGPAPGGGPRPSAPPPGGGGGPRPPAPPRAGTPPATPASVRATPGNIFSRIGTAIATATSPTTNLQTAARTPIERWAAIVGRDSNSAAFQAQQIANAYGLTPVGRAGIEQGLRADATRSMIRDLQAQGLAYYRGRAAPSNYLTASNNAKSLLGQYVFHPDIADSIANVADRGGIASNEGIGGALMRAQSTAKQTIFNLSNFHTMTEGVHAAASGPETLHNYSRAFLSDSFAQGVRNGSMAGDFLHAAQAGVTHLNAGSGSSADINTQISNIGRRRAVAAVTGGVGGGAASYVEAKTSGKSDEEARQQALLGAVAGATLGGVPMMLGGRGTVSEELGHALWDRAVPLAKVTAWKGLVNGGMDATEAASVVNERFGGLNYAQMGRNPTLQDAGRLGLQAPDWTESTIRQLGGALFGGTGQGARASHVAKALGGTLAVTELLNHFTTGHWTDQNQAGHQFEVEMPNPAGGYTHIGVLPGNYQSYISDINKLYADDAAKRGSDLTNYALSRLSAPVSMLGQTVRAAQATNSLGLPYGAARAGAVPAVLSNLSPIGISQVAQGVNKADLSPAIAIAMAALGLNPRYTTPSAPGGAAPTGGAAATRTSSSGSSSRTSPTTRTTPRTRTR